MFGPITDSPEVVEAKAQAKARADERENKRREEAAAALGAEKEMMKRSWLEAGGDEEGFEKSWPGMQNDLLADRARKEQDLAQARTTSFYQEAF
jgi:hypothetical protein